MSSKVPGLSSRDRNGGPSYPIPVWNGLLDHKPKIGSAIWVYLWCLDRITKEESGAGYIFGGAQVTAQRIAVELKDSHRTVRRHLSRLAKHGYIELKRDLSGFVIVVTNSKKFNVWRPDKNVQSERTKVSSPLDKNVQPNKEDTASDTASDSKPSVVVSPADWIPVEAWAGFCEMRKKIRAPLTDRAIALIVRELEKLRSFGQDPGAVLDQSVRNNWRDVYPLKGAHLNGNNRGNNRAEQRQADNLAALDAAFPLDR